MTAVIKTLTFSTLPDTNPSTPPTGYSKPSGSDAARIGLGLFYLSGVTETIWVDNTTLTGTTIYSRVTLPATVDGAAAGCCLIDSSGNGYEVITGTTNNNFRIFAVTNGKLSGGVLATFAVSPIANAVIEFSHTGTTLTVKQNGSAVGTLTAITRPTNPMAGATSRGGKLAAMQSEYDAAQSVVSINGGSPFTASQISGTASLTGFTGVVTSIASDLTGLNFSGIGGTATDPTYTKSVPVDGNVYPKRGSTATLTFAKGAETANGTILINKDADQTTVIVSSPINDDITTLFGAIKNVTGRSAANTDEVYHAIPAPMLTNGMDTILPADAILPNGEMQFYNAGSFPCWIWTAATGINYYYWVTITESGSVVVTAASKNIILGLGFGIGI